MKLDVCVLKFKGKLHIGSGRWLEHIDNIIHSDTLFNAICWCYRMLYGNDQLEEFLNRFAYSTPLYITSAFPFIDGLYFFPRPMNCNLAKLLRDASKDVMVDNKAIKKIRFVEKGIFEKLINLENVNGVLSDQFFSSKEVNIKPEYVEYRNMLDRLSKSSTVYRVKYVNSNYWFAYKVSSEYSNAIKASIRLLADEGIGGERSIGSGLFSVDFTSIDVKSVDESRRVVTLSLVNPSIQEVSEFVGDEYAKYMVIRRGGGFTDPRLSSNERRRSLYMITEGSFLPCITGRVVNIGVDKQVYEYGICFGIGARYEEERRA